MKLDRNINSNGQGKYALVRLRRINDLVKSEQNECRRALATLERYGALRYGNEGPSKQFFVLGYADKFTPHALSAYAAAVDLLECHDQATLRPIDNPEMAEYAAAMQAEAKKARETASKIPDAL